MTVMDAFLRYLWVHPLKDKCAVTVAEKITYDQLSTYGVPHQIYTDLGKEFDCRIMSEITRATGVEHRFAWTQYQPWVVTDEFWEETPRIEGWQEDLPAEPTMDLGDEEMPTREEPREMTQMDTSPGKKKTGTVPARLTSYNGCMRWTNSKPDRRHRYQSNGKEKRNIVSNRNRNFTDVEEQSQETQLRRTMPATQEPTRTVPTTWAS